MWYSPRAAFNSWLLAGVVGVAIAGQSLAAQSAGTPTSTAQGVYSEDQAKRGKKLFLSNCSSCHLADLSGDGMAPPLAGETFMTPWKGRTVGDLFDRILNTMPPHAPNSLGTDRYVDIVAFLLQANEAPAGKDELKPDTDALKGVVISPPDSR